MSSPTAPFTYAQLARGKSRHTWLILSFVLFFALPVTVSSFYLYTVAQDQYASSVGFTVRSEEVSSAVDILGGISNLSGASSSDTDVLYEFIQSQQLVSAIQQELDLVSIFGRYHDVDPVFAFKPGGTIEDLSAYWGRMVKVFYDSGTGLIELRVTAFTPEDAFAIATAIFDHSSDMVNDLSAIAREDATRYAREDLELALNKLKNARQAISEYRAKTQIVDPEADLQGQMGILNNLQQQFAEALIDLDLLRANARDGDPRIQQAEIRIRVIQERIAEERAKFGTEISDLDEDYVSILGEFERLSVDLEFAQSAYLTALAAFDSAVAQAQRQSRYLAAYLRPSVAERAQYPQRETLLLLIAVFSCFFWIIASLVYYSIRDRG